MRTHTHCQSGLSFRCAPSCRYQAQETKTRVGECRLAGCSKRPTECLQIRWDTGGGNTGWLHAALAQLLRARATPGGAPRAREISRGEGRRPANVLPDATPPQQWQRSPDMRPQHFFCRTSVARPGRGQRHVEPLMDQL